MTENIPSVEAALLEQYEKSIDAMLEVRSLPKRDRLIFQAQKLFVTFLKAMQQDRDKVSIMWRGYQNGYRLLWILIPLVVSDIFIRLWTLLYP